MLKNIWDIATGNYRFIKYDGSQFHRGKLSSILDRPEMKIGLACFVFNCASAAYLNGDMAHLLSGQMQDISRLTTNAIIDNSRELLKGGVLSLALSKYIINVEFPKKEKAIDTHGTSLSRAQLSLQDIRNLNRTRLYGFILFCSYSLPIAIQLFNSNTTHISTGLAMYATVALTAFERSAKILNGKYVICEDPPKLTQRSKVNSSILGGLKTPS